MISQNSKASVADVLAFDSLPDATKALIERIYGEAPAEGTKLYTEEDMREAYEAGWEDCGEEIEAPWMSPSRMDYYMQSRKKGS